MRSHGNRLLKYLPLFLFLASCVASREIVPPYKPRVETLVRQLTEQPYSVHIVEHLRFIARVDMRTQQIEINAQWADVLMSKDPDILRAILAHEIAHDKLGHRYAAADDKHALQTLELEADQEAVKTLHARGYNPGDYLRAMKMFKEIEDKNSSGFREQYYSTHPYAGERLEKIENMIAALGPGPKTPSGKGEERKAPEAKPSLVGAKPAASPGVRAEKPEWKVGYEWKYAWTRPDGRGTLVREVAKEDLFETVPSYVVKAEGSESFYAKDGLGLLATISKGKVLLKRDVPRHNLSWPLEVGKEWGNIYTLERLEQKSSQKFDLRMVVTKVEEVRVSAGSFETFKIEVSNSRGGKLIEELWYAPQVKWFVKSKSYGQDGVREEELVSFKVD